jgi:hypothetical protein
MMISLSSSSASLGLCPANTNNAVFNRQNVRSGGGTGRRAAIAVAKAGVQLRSHHSYCFSVFHQSSGDDDDHERRRNIRTFTTSKSNANNNNNNNNNDSRRRRTRRKMRQFTIVRATKEEKKSSTAEEVDEITKKWGLEAGLWKIFKSNENGGSKTTTGEEGEGQLSGSRMDMAKQLLKTYGSAYLITSISLSLVSFGVFYVLVSSGVDVAALLSIVGITATQNSEKVGTVAIAYAAHKAASPIRFPPTVALTPIVAGWMGKTGNKEEEEDNNKDGEGSEEK